MMRAEELLDTIDNAEFGQFFGEVLSIGQGSLAASGPHCRVGDICTIGTAAKPARAEVVAISRAQIDLIPFEGLDHIRPGDRVMLAQHSNRHKVGDAFQGRAINAFGKPIDGGPPIAARVAKARQLGAAIEKTVLDQRLQTGIRAIDALVPLAKGQRTGIFAASGAGKTTLIEQLLSSLQSDKTVLCLIGERGREVDRFWNRLKQEQDCPEFVLVAATADESPSARVRAIKQAISLCEYWRDQGQHVTLLVDSATRLAMAYRELGLAAGLPPALRSYTPNVFTALPELVERCGAVKGRGSISAIFTVLSETDDVDDPIVELMKSILDGHIVLSRKLSERGHFPAIDVPASVSRVADQLLDQATGDAARRFRGLSSLLDESRAMVSTGLYQSGADPELDVALKLQKRMSEFVQQTSPEPIELDDLDRRLRRCVTSGGIA